MVRLYADESVERPIVTGLRNLGVDLLTAEEDARTATDDSIILDHAADLNRVCFTRDEDFLREAARRQREGVEFHGVIYAHKILASIGECIEGLEILAKVGNPSDFIGTVYYLPL